MMKRAFIFLFCLAILTLPTIMPGQTQESNDLFPVNQNGKWGYRDSTGKIIIPPQFDEASRFSEGLALVKLSGKYGYVDRTGQMVIKPQYIRAERFTEGLAWVLVDGKLGYIDQTGKFIIPPQFTRVFGASHFSEGLALVAMNNKLGYINKNGQFIVKPQYEIAAAFSEGLALVVISDKIGYIDKSGKIAIKPQYEIPNYLKPDVWGVPGGTPGGGAYPMPTPEPGFSVRHEYLDVFRFSEGLVVVHFNGKYGYADKTGRIVIKPQFNQAFPFSEGLARIAVGGQQMPQGLIGGAKDGFIDKTGQIVIQPQFDHVNASGPYEFSRGRARVIISGQGHYIDRSGKIIQ